MRFEHFYNIFHKSGTVQNKLISKKNFTYRTVIDVVDKFVINNMNMPKIKILDYGCGVGTVSLYLASKGNSVIGVDISNKAITYANKSASQMDLKSFVHYYDLKQGQKTIVSLAKTIIASFASPCVVKVRMCLYVS